MGWQEWSALALLAQRIWTLEQCFSTIPALGEAWCVANDFQYIGCRCRYGVVNDRLHNYQSAPTCCWCKRGQQHEALGRSKGGFSTKIHAICDALGNPLRFILTGGERSDYTQALALIEGMKADAVLADKGYDADYIMDAIEKMGALVVIPPKSNRKIQRDYDKDIYKERNMVERMFNKLKHFRKIATRYDKRADSFLAWIVIGAIFLWSK